MLSEQRFIGWSARLAFCFVLLFGLLSAIAVSQYPSKSQVGKDGTAVLLEDFANPPLSSPTHGGLTPGAIDFKGQLGRETSLRSEPSNAPLAASVLSYLSRAATS